MKNISIVAAVADNLAIGGKQSLLWRLPNDMVFFKNLTEGNAVVMGRKTFESLPKGALPNRMNIILTHEAGVEYAGAHVASSLEDAFKMVEEGMDIFVIGGGEIYNLAKPYINMLYITEVHHVFRHADTFFFEIDKSEWEEMERSSHFRDSRHEYDYDFVVYKKKK